MAMEEEFEPALEVMEGAGGPGAGRTECFFSFVLSFYFSVLAWRGERSWRAQLGLLDSTVASSFACNLVFYIPLHAARRAMAMVASPLLP